MKRLLATIATLVTAAAIPCGCSSKSAGPKEIAPTGSSASARDAAPTDLAAFIVGARHAEYFSGTDHEVEVIGLVVCDYLDEGANLAWIGAHLSIDMQAIGAADDKASAVVVAAAIVNLCPQYLPLVSTSSSP